MRINKSIALGLTAITAVHLISAPASAKSFKAKYYKECYAEVDAVADLVKPTTSLSDTAGKATGLLGSVGSFAGIGGFGGSLSKAATTMQKINKYSGLIDDVGGFSAQMATDHPDPNDRFAAYGTHMSNDATDLEKVQSAVTQSQECYNTAFDTLSAQVAAGELKKSKAKKQLGEIQKGSKATGDVLINAMDHINKNITSYDQVLNTETQAFQPNIQSLFAAQQNSVNAGITQSAYNQVATIGGVAGAGTVSSIANLRGATAGGMFNAGTLSGLAGMLSNEANADDTSQQGLQAVAASSQQYLGIYESLQGTIEKQRLLEVKVNKGL
ncbi:hypothetical protein [Kordiimonas pumila]|uniref:Uncharacterized protein n=1 Tax=Kordiimonas pumila TaxID=2161677 RepID=A0ABV7D6B5_9PROT|nr:hypothetical protein [Kordiimonas pumila]